MLLKDKITIVTGASRGIGKAISQRFSKEGAHVFALARNITGNSCHKNIIAVPCDVSQENRVKTAFDFIVQKADKIDILVNAAAIAEPYSPIFQSEFSEWKKVFETNVFGTFLMMKYTIPLMRRNQCGKIINFFGGGDGPFPGFSAYNASKTAIARLTETVAKEVIPFGIDINIIAPGPVKTKLFDEMFSQSEEKPPPTGDVEKAVELVLFLASDKSNGLSGKFLSAVWDNWSKIPEILDLIMQDPDIFTLRRRKGGF